MLTPLINDSGYLLSGDCPKYDWILLDYLFAYIHERLSKYIDFTIFIDTPLDIAMSRRILRDVEYY